MAVPKQRQTKSRGRRRRGGHAKIKQISLVKCFNCNQSIQPHRVCSYCGHYKGKEVVDVTAKVKSGKLKVKSKGK